MGAGKAGGRNDAGSKRTVAQRYTKPTTTKPGTPSNAGNYQTIDESGKVVGSSFISQGKYKSNKDIDNLPISSGKIIGSILKGPLAKGAMYNRKFFVNSVIGNIKKGSNITTTKKEFARMSDFEKESLYSDYTKARQSGTKDAYGRDVIGGKGEGNKSNLIKKNIGGKIVSVAPTAAEVSQSEAANATSEEDSIYTRKKKTKARGRSATILSSSKGVKDDDLTLGKPSLLGS